MSVEDVQELEAEYQRLKEAQQVGSDDGVFGRYQATLQARDQVRDFCLTTGKDITLLHPVFNAEDLAMANLAA